MTQLTRWDPFRDLISLREAMDRLLEESVVRPRTEGPRALPVDMYETEEALVVKAAIPGVDPEDIDISITGDTLTINGEIKMAEEARRQSISAASGPTVRSLAPWRSPWRSRRMRQKLSLRMAF